MITLSDLALRAYSEGKRLTAPLVGFPGVKDLGKTIKVVQSNYKEHVEVLKYIMEELSPDLQFILMDLSVEANALGRYTVFPLNESATIPKTKFSLSDLDHFKQIDITADSRVRSYIKTIEMITIMSTPKSMIGAYVTGPYTLAGLIMGAEEAAETTIMDPDHIGNLCAIVTEKIIDYCEVLIQAGAKTICILEPSGVMLGPAQFEEFSANYVKKIIACCSCQKVNSVYHVCGNSTHIIQGMISAGVQGLSLDSKEAGVDLPAIAAQISPDVALIGNLNPTGTILNGTPEEVESEVRMLLDDMKDWPNFILSTGCDLPPETPFENIRAFQRAGKNYTF